MQRRRLTVHSSGSSVPAHDPETNSIPIIVLTAHAMAGDREKALAAGADEYDTKPIEFKRLLGKIKEFLND